MIPPADRAAITEPLLFCLDSEISEKMNIASTDPKRHDLSTKTKSL